MKRLWVAAALAPLSFAASAQAQTISSGTSTPVFTSTAGSTADLTITSGGSITPTTGGTSSTATVNAVTINSNNNVINAGSINFTGLNNVVGVQALGGNTGVINNSGGINVTESTSYSDANSDGINDKNGSNALGVNQYATGFGRFGIQVTGVSVFGTTPTTTVTTNPSGTLTTPTTTTTTTTTNGVTTTTVVTTNGVTTTTVVNPYTIDNSGSITVIGENSAGVEIGQGGIAGGLSNSGTISVTGGNANDIVAGTPDKSYGIHAIGKIGGDVVISGSVSATGQGATAVALDGGVGGKLDINGTLTATGYESTTAPTTTYLYTLLKNQAAEELLQGGSALTIGGSVTGAITLDAAIAASGTTAAVAGASITSYGSAPAIFIGGSAPISINAGGASSSDGLLIGGTVIGNSVFAEDNAGNPVNATGLSIGNGASAVAIGGNIRVTGTLEALTVGDPVNAATGNPTALSLGDASAHSIFVDGGTILASSTTASVKTAGTSTTPAVSPVQATAIQLGAQANVPTITNTGIIESAITGISTLVGVTATGGTQGYATAIADASGSVTSITNTNTILAKVTPIDPTKQLDPTNSRATAIDLRANTTGATITQSAYVVPSGVTTTVTPSITGDVLFGSGSGTLNLEAGTLVGGLSFGSSANNDIEITNGATSVGALAEAAGGSLKINVQSGTLAITSPTTNLLASQDAATLAAQNNQALPTAPSSNPVTLGASTIHVGSSGQLILSVFGQNQGAATPQLKASGALTVDQGGTIGLNFLSKITAPVTYDIIEAGQISLPTSTTSTPVNVVGQLPYLYNGAASIGTGADGTSKALDITVSQKTAAQLQFNAAQSAFYNAFYAAFDKSDASNNNSVGSNIGTVTSAVLSQTNKADFDRLYNQFMPDYSGGPFDTLVTGQEALASAEADAPTKLQTDGTRGWVQEIGFSENRSSGDVNGYSAKGFGFAGGTEHVDGGNAVGLSAALVSSSIGDTGRPVGSTQSATAIEGGAYWRTTGEGLNFGASANGGWVFLQSHRVLLEQSGTNDASFFREAKANWNGAIASGSLSVSYRESFGRYYIKPEVLAEYVMLYESAYSEHGAGSAVDLSINSKLSKEGVVQGDLVLGATYGDTIHWTPEVTFGWREIVQGGPDNTTGHFAGGQSFTLSPDYQEKGGLLARLGLRASGNFADFSANAGGVFRAGYDQVDARATARFLF